MPSKFSRLQNESQSGFIQITRTINTGINYLPLPEPKLFHVQPRHSIDLKHQIEEDFSIRFRSFNEAELNDLLRSETTNFDRFKSKQNRRFLLRHFLNEFHSHWKIVINVYTVVFYNLFIIVSI